MYSGERGRGKDDHSTIPNIARPFLPAAGGGFLTIWFLDFFLDLASGTLEAAAAQRTAGDVVRDDDVALAGHDRFSVDALEERGRGVVVPLEPALLRVPMDGLGADVAGLALRVVRARLRRDRYGLRVLRVGMILLGAAASLQSLSWPVFQCCSWRAGQQ